MGGHFPDEKQTLLLKSALSERLKAIRYFVQWLEINKLDQLDPVSKTFLTDFMDSIDAGSHRLLPLVIHNLGDDTHPYFKFLKGTRKNYWVKNKQIEYRAQEVLKVLEQNRIPYMVIKGLNLASEFYENTGLRPMYNGDILFPHKYKNRVQELAEKGSFGNEMDIYRRKARNAAQVVPLEFEGKINMDLHWSVFKEYVHAPDASDFIWRQRAEPKVLSHQPTPTHALFISIIRGNSFDSIPPVRWVADAEMIIRKSEIDWNELLGLCEQFHFKPYLKRAFTYLNEKHQFRIPDEFLEKLNKLQVSESEEEYYRAASRNLRKYGILGLVWYGTIKKVHFHRLFLKNSDISLTKYLFYSYFNRITTDLSKY